MHEYVAVCLSPIHKSWLIRVLQVIFLKKDPGPGGSALQGAAPSAARLPWTSPVSMSISQTIHTVHDIASLKRRSMFSSGRLNHTRIMRKNTAELLVDSFHDMTTVLILGEILQIVSPSPEACKLQQEINSWCPQSILNGW